MAPETRASRVPTWILFAMLAAPDGIAHGIPRPLEVIGPADAPSFVEVVGAAMSPDGTSVYVMSGGNFQEVDTLNVFARDPATGRLAYVEKHEPGGGFPAGVTVSPDGLHVYTMSYYGGVKVYARNGGTGALTLIGTSAGTVPGEMSFSGDGAYAYVLYGSYTYVYSRNAGTGMLTSVQTVSTAGDEIALSPDGAHLYIASGNNVFVFSRDAGTGMITYQSTVTDGVGGVDGIDHAYGVAVSPDGAHVYVTGYNDNAVAAFSRNAGTGALTFVEVQRNGVGGVTGIAGASAVTVSADGQWVYVGGSIAAFARNAGTGALTFVGSWNAVESGINGILGSPDSAYVYVAMHGSYHGAITAYAVDGGTGALSSISAVTQIIGDSAVVSPDGANVYFMHSQRDRLFVFSRDAGSGAIKFLEEQVDGVAGVDGLESIYGFGLAISPDGAHVYAAASWTDAVLLFSRAPSTGALTYVQTLRDGVGGVDGLDGAIAVTISPDGANAYVAGFFEDAVAVFSRNAGTGALTFVEAERDGVDGVDGLDEAWDVTVSPDGAHVYVAGAADDAVAVFARNAGTGALTFVQVVRNGVGGVEGLDQPRSLAMSPDGAHLYAGGAGVVGANFGGLMAVFARDAGTGALTFVESHMDQRGGVTGMGGGNVLMSPDGERVYVDADAVFSRDPVTGTLTFVDSGTGGGGRAAISPDGAHLYGDGTYYDPVVRVFALGFAGCPPAPLTGCLASSGGSVNIIQPSTVVWRWTKGPATTTTDFGTPTATTHYALCIYDESGPPTLVFRALMTAAGTCKPETASCWKSVATGFKYRDGWSTPEGMRWMTLKAGAAGASQILVRSGRVNIQPPATPLGLPVRVQLQSSDAGCFEATYSTVIYNTSATFRAQPD